MLVFFFKEFKKNSKGKRFKIKLFCCSCVHINCVITVKYEARSAGFLFLFKFFFCNHHLIIVISFSFTYLKLCILVSSKCS